MGEQYDQEQGGHTVPKTRLNVCKGKFFSKPFGNLIHLTHHWPKNLTKILILHLTGYFLSEKKYEYMLCNCTSNEVILSTVSTKNLHVKNRIQIFVKFLGQWWVK